MKSYFSTNGTRNGNIRTNRPAAIQWFRYLTTLPSHQSRDNEPSDYILKMVADEPEGRPDIYDMANYFLGSGQTSPFCCNECMAEYSSDSIFRGFRTGIPSLSPFPMRVQSSSVPPPVSGQRLNMFPYPQVPAAAPSGPPLGYAPYRPNSPNFASPYYMATQSGNQLPIMNHVGPRNYSPYYPHQTQSPVHTHGQSSVSVDRVSIRPNTSFYPPLQVTSTPASSLNRPRSTGNNVPPIYIVPLLLRRKPLSESKRPSIKESFNALRCIMTIKPAPGRTWEKIGGMKPARDTLPIWRLQGDDKKPESTIHMTYDKLFDMKIFPPQPISSLSTTNARKDVAARIIPSEQFQLSSANLFGKHYYAPAPETRLRPLSPQRKEQNSNRTFGHQSQHRWGNQNISELKDLSSKPKITSPREDYRSGLQHQRNTKAEKAAFPWIMPENSQWTDEEATTLVDMKSQKKTRKEIAAVRVLTSFPVSSN
jgi:hypothetical protein